MKRPHILMILFLSFLLHFALYSTALASWTFENIDSVGTDSFPSIAVDSNDKIHVSYTNSNDEIKYATNKSGFWITSSIDLIYYADHFNDIALDLNNKVHIVYHYQPTLSYFLKYATNKSGSWIKSKVDDSFGAVYSIATDSNNKVHISYYHNFHLDYDLKYATNKSGKWAKRVIDSIGDVGDYSSIAVDSNNKVHISYYDSGNNDLKYATNRTGTWVTTIVDSIGDMGRYSSIALDSNDNVHISYCDQSNYKLRYASNISGGWSKIDIDDVSCELTSIAIDSSDHVHIGYYDDSFSDRGIKYATNSSGFWETVIVKPDIYFSSFSGTDNLSLAVDTNDNVYIVYPNDDTEQLELATYSPPPTIPNPPSSLMASPASTSAISLTWTDNARNETGFKIETKLGDCASADPWEEIATVSQNTTEYTHPGLFLNTTYSYQMRSYNGAGDSDYSNCSSATTYAKDVTHVTLLSPNGRETLKSGSSYPVEWEAPPNAVKFKLRYSIDNGLTWLRVHPEPYVLGTIYSWIPPALKKNKIQCLMKVTGYDSRNILVGSDRSDGVFTLEVLTITSPVLDQILSAGGRHTIMWETNDINGVPSSTSLSYIIDGGITWKLVGTALGNPGTFDWDPLPTVLKAKTRCRIKLLLKDSLGTTIASALSPFFTIQPYQPPEPPASDVITTLDSDGHVGMFTSIATGSDGLPVIAYHDNANVDLKVVKCGNSTCSEGNVITTVDNSQNYVGWYPSIAIGSDGYPIISHQDDTTGDLKFVKCGNISCSAGNSVTVLDADGYIGQYSSLASGADGLPVIAYSYHDGIDMDLRVLKCGNDSCTSGNSITTVDSAGSVGWYIDMKIGTDGFPVIVYRDSPNDFIKVVKCGNAGCTSGNEFSVVVSSPGAGCYNSIAIGSDGFPVISYWNSLDTDLALRVVKCGNISCSSGNAVNTVETGRFGEYNSLAIGADELPIISYYDYVNGDLKVAHCGDISCSYGNIITTLDFSGDVGLYTSVTIGSDGLPIISYYDATNQDLKTVKCARASCSND